MVADDPRRSHGASPSTRRCQSCGALFEPQRKRCPLCGTVEETRRRRCERCRGWFLPIDPRECPVCGSEDIPEL